MAVAFHNTVDNINTSTASTTVTFNAPASPAAGEIWICTACFRGGSSATITGVPATFHLIDRIDSGSGSTNVTLVAYWYLATGAEGAGFATLTISSSKYVAQVSAFSGCNTTTPVVSGSVQSAGNLTTTASVTASAFATGQLAYGSAAQQGGTSESLTDTNGVVLNDTRQTTTGGSGATNVGMQGGYTTNLTGGGETWTASSTSGSSIAIHTFTLDVPAAAPPVQLLPHPAFIYLRKNS